MSSKQSDSTKSEEENKKTKHSMKTFEHFHDGIGFKNLYGLMKLHRGATNHLAIATTIPMVAP